jgi:hypothetical protein
MTDVQAGSVSHNERQPAVMWVGAADPADAADGDWQIVPGGGTYRREGGRWVPAALPAPAPLGEPANPDEHPEDPAWWEAGTWPPRPGDAR